MSWVGWIGVAVSLCGFACFFLALWPRRSKPLPASTRLDLFERALKDIAGEVPRGVLPASDVLGARSFALSILRQGRGLKPL